MVRADGLDLRGPNAISGTDGALPATPHTGTAGLVLATSIGRYTATQRRLLDITQPTNYRMADQNWRIVS